MKRSSPIARRTSLTSDAQLKRKTAMLAGPLARSTLHKNQAAHRHEPKHLRPITSGVPRKIRDALAVRSGGICEVGQRGCTVRATDCSHRIATGMGGRKGAAAAAHHVLSNILAACRWCHSEAIHGQPARAKQHGWMLADWQNPLVEPCLYRGAVRWLDDSGHVLSTNPHEPEEG